MGCESTDCTGWLNITITHVALELLDKVPMAIYLNWKNVCTTPATCKNYIRFNTVEHEMFPRIA